MLIVVKEPYVFRWNLYIIKQSKSYNSKVIFLGLSKVIRINHVIHAYLFWRQRHSRRSCSYFTCRLLINSYLYIIFKYMFKSTRLMTPHIFWLKYTVWLTPFFKLFLIHINHMFNVLKMLYLTNLFFERIHVI
jgi:hypothetical protein